MGIGNDRSTAILAHPPIVTREIALSGPWLMNHPTVMYRCSGLRAVGRYDESLQRYPEGLKSSKPITRKLREVEEGMTVEIDNRLCKLF
jgi:hypothetical protein